MSVRQRPLWRTFWGSVGVLLLLAGCDGSDTTIVLDAAVAECTAGALNCPCADDAEAACEAGLFCADGLCIAPSCDPGDEGCACLAGDRCRTDPTGRPMTCVAGVCEVTPCPVGGEGCACGAFEACDAGLVCQGGVCAAPGCTPGDLDCICDAGACAVGLVCDAGRCIDPGCQLGSEGCLCNAGECLGELTCRDNRCQAACPAGQPGCACDAGGCADGAFCIADTCTACTAGEVGCVCGAGDRCADGAACADGLCAPVECPAGTAGCPCDAGACGADLACDAGTCVACPAGQIGCACDAGACADPTAAWCAGDTCAPLACELGAEGCGCGFADAAALAEGRAEACAVNDRGEALACDGGLCVAPTCTPGDTGCPCQMGAGCLDAGDMCDAGFCQPRGCAPGTAGCGCTAQGRCVDGLTCRAGAVCVESVGFPQGDCFEDGTCRDGAACDAGGTCQACLPGSLGCTCEDGGCDGALACEGGLCRVSALPIEARIPPAVPLCFTWCQADIEDADGRFRRCPADHLMAGCLGDQVCNAGSCTAPGDAPRACEAESDCPHWQTCIAGQCYSNCVRDADCSAGYECSGKVCRRPCTQEDGAETCGEGAYCNVPSDGAPGHCRVLEPATEGAEGDDAAPEVIEVNRVALAFSNTNPSEQLLITNRGPVHTRITIRKRSHRLSTAVGLGEVVEDLDDGVECDPGDCPLFWMPMYVIGDEPARTQTLEVGVPAGESARIVLEDAGGVDAPRWQGALEIKADGANTQRITLTYDQSPEGLWRGEVFYFGLFGDEGLADWAALPNPPAGSGIGDWRGSKDDSDAVDQVGNALVQRWSAFRRRRISFNEFQAAFTSVRTESWRWQSMVDVCPESHACYPFSENQAGFKEMTSNVDTVPVPSGVIEMPFAMTLRPVDPEGDPQAMAGRVDSTTALHYAGFPQVNLRFASDAAGCDRDASGVCLAFLDDLEATVAVGGRYAADGAGCAADPAGVFEPVQIPWLVPGFSRNTRIDPATQRPVRLACRDGSLPFQAGLDPAAEARANLALTGANPIPDGRARRRSLELVDGALINQSTLFILFRERFGGFQADDEAAGFAAYGVMLLHREPADIDPTDINGDEIPDAYQGSAVDLDRPEPEGLLAVECSADLVTEALGVGARLTDATADGLAVALLDGVRPGQAPTVLDVDSVEQPHYLCVDTGLIDGGPDNDTPHGLPGLNNNSCGRRNGICEDGGNASAVVNATRQDDVQIRCALGTDLDDCGLRFQDDRDLRAGCPEGSEVRYFTVDSTVLSQADIAALPCQRDGRCAETLREWQANRGVLMQSPARWTCSDANRVYCSDDRANLREGKTFYAQADEVAVFTPLQPAIEAAFRYKTRFQSREGRDIGFAPQICDPAVDDVPYCYDPAAIEALRDRVDCLVALFQGFDLQADVRLRVLQTLRGAFASTAEFMPQLGYEVHREGFERLHAELLIMLGDEALTRAFASRFDLAGQNAAAFPGAALEAGGFNLAGQAGYEMYSLYQAAQLYQEALDRFYSLSPVVWQALTGPAADNFIQAETATTWFDRLTRASTQKTRAWSEIARRYQGFNRPDLARAVIERAYTAGYLESVVMARMLTAVVEAVAVEDETQVKAIMEAAQGRYRIALLEMRTLYATLTDAVTVFGVRPDEVPLPALDSADYRQSNAFEALLRRAQAKAQVAEVRETRALESTRAFDTDTERFQSELVNIRTTHENQLADICGVFEGDDGVVYPAIAYYAERGAATRDFGDPCGAMGNGQLHDTRAEFETLQLDLRKVVVQMENVLATVEIERDRASTQCGLRFELADFTFQQAGRELNLRDEIADIRFVIDRADRALGHVGSILNFGLTPQAAIYTVAAAAVEVGNAFGERAIIEKERALGDIERETARWQTEQQCDVLTVDSNARVAETLLRLRELELEELRLEILINQALGNAKALRNRALRLQQQQARAEQLALDVEAARNDPNVRIFRNDAILNADLAFDDAMREAYRATRVLEYYTGQSYADTERLFFIRLVERGDDNLNNYLTDLSNAFFAFEEEFGLPDNRVLQLSLKDDILKVPFYDEAGQPLTAGERTARMHAALRDPKWLDRNGFVTLPFDTGLEALSPITRNHKILYVEAEIIASDFGDHLGRIYLRQSGTGVIQGTDDALNYYRLPATTAVINPFFNGSRFFDPTVYKNYRLRDRPLVNTAWDLVINTRSEAVNEDLDLQSLTDLRLFVYYTDFSGGL